MEDNEGSGRRKGNQERENTCVLRRENKNDVILAKDKELAEVKLIGQS